MGEGGRDGLAVVGLIDGPVLAAGVVEVHQADGQPVQVGVDGQAPRVLDEGQVVEVPGAFHVVLMTAHGLDGQPHSDLGGQLWRPAPGGVDDVLGLQHPTGFQGHRAHRRPGYRKVHDPVGDEVSA